MGGNHRVRSVVLLRASGRAQGRTNAGSGDVGNVRSHHWCVARYDRERAGIFRGGLDGRSKTARSARVSPTERRRKLRR
jgi:hypothetical protein